MVGIAPGGAVAVWVAGASRKEIFFGQANKIDLEPSQAFVLSFKNKEEADEYMEEGLVEDLTPEEIESIKKNGVPFGLWARYRNLYDWRLTERTGNKISDIDVKFVNGEYIREWINVNKNDDDIKRPVPNRISFITAIDNKKVIYIVHLNEIETMTAFEKLGDNNKKVYIEFEPRIPRKNTKVRIYNEKESITLKIFVSDDW